MCGPHSTSILSPLTDGSGQYAREEFQQYDSQVGLSGIVILVLDRKCDITIYHGFYKSLWIDCSIKVF